MIRSEALLKLQQSVDAAGGQTAYAKQHGICRKNLHATLHRKIPLQGVTLDSLGLKRVLAETFVPLSNAFSVPEGYEEVVFKRPPGRLKKPAKQKKSTPRKKKQVKESLT